MRPPVTPATDFSSSPKSQPSPSANLMSASKNILSSDVEIIGNLKFSHDLIIDGSIDGEVVSDGNLTVGENARIKGEIKTKSVTVFGKVEGNITVTDRCELKSKAELIGDIRAGTLSIEEGAAFMGASTVGAAAGSASPRAAGHAPSAPSNPSAGPAYPAANPTPSLSPNPSVSPLVSRPLGMGAPGGSPLTSIPKAPFGSPSNPPS